MGWLDVVGVVGLVLLTEFLAFIGLVLYGVRKAYRCPRCKAKMRDVDPERDIQNNLPGVGWEVTGQCCPKCGWLKIRCHQEFTTADIEFAEKQGESDASTDAGGPGEAKLPGEREAPRGGGDGGDAPRLGRDRQDICGRDRGVPGRVGGDDPAGGVERSCPDRS